MSVTIIVSTPTLCDAGAAGYWNSCFGVSVPLHCIVVLLGWDWVKRNPFALLRIHQRGKHMIWYNESNMRYSSATNSWGKRGWDDSPSRVAVYYVNPCQCWVISRVVEGDTSHSGHCGVEKAHECEGCVRAAVNRTPTARMLEKRRAAWSPKSNAGNWEHWWVAIELEWMGPDVVFGRWIRAASEIHSAEMPFLLPSNNCFVRGTLRLLRPVPSLHILF